MMYSVLSLFPIQFLSLGAYLILRIAVGYCFVYMGLRHIGAFKELRHIIKLPFWPFGKLSVLILIIVELILGIMFLFGAFTQLAAIIAFFLCVEMITFNKRWRHQTIPTRMFWFLMIGCCLSLFITGAGVFAVDLPV